MYYVDKGLRSAAQAGELKKQILENKSSLQFPEEAFSSG